MDNRPYGSRKISKLVNLKIRKLENERSVRNYIFNEEHLKGRN